MMTDPIADMLTRIRNAVRVRKSEVIVPDSHQKFAVAKILEQEGYLARVEKRPGKLSVSAEIKLTLTYGTRKESSIHSLERVSKPGRRVYAGYRELPRVANDLGIAIVSTPKGIMTSKEARKLKLGGEVICEVY